MKHSADLVGKPISGVVAVPSRNSGAMKIWMLQFTDGTHVEFVSPGARRTLDRIARGSHGAKDRQAREQTMDPQLVLNVA